MANGWQGFIVSQWVLDFADPFFVCFCMLFLGSVCFTLQINDIVSEFE